MLPIYWCAVVPFGNTAVPVLVAALPLLPISRAEGYHCHLHRQRMAMMPRAASSYLTCRYPRCLGRGRAARRRPPRPPGRREFIQLLRPVPTH